MAFNRRRGVASPLARGMLFGAGVAAVNRPRGTQSAPPPAPAAAPTVIVVESKSAPAQSNSTRASAPVTRQNDYDDGVSPYGNAAPRYAEPRLKVVYGNQTKIIAFPKTVNDAVSMVRTKFGVPTNIPSILKATIGGTMIELDEDSFDMIGEGDTIYLVAEPPFRLTISIAGSVDSKGARTSSILTNSLEKVSTVLQRIAAAEQLSAEYYQLVGKNQPLQGFMRLCDYSITGVDTVSLERL